MRKCQIGISSVWLEGNPCNSHLLKYSKEIKESVNKSEMIGLDLIQ